MQRIATPILACLASATLAAAGQGDDLARGLLEAEDDAARAKLVESVDRLPASERQALLARAHEVRTDGRWARLAPALVRMKGEEAARAIGEVARLGQESGAPWRQALEAVVGLPPELKLGELVRGVVHPERRVREAHLEALIPSLQTWQGVRALCDAAVRLREAPPTDEEAGEVDLDALLSRVVHEAVVRVDDPSSLLRDLRADDDPALVAGLARGMGQRPLPESESTDSDESVLSDAALAQREAFEQALVALSDCRDPRVIVAIYESLPRVSEALTVTWATVLIDDVEHPDRRVSDAAWSALKRLTGEALPQASAPWRAWWAREEAANR